MFTFFPEKRGRKVSFAPFFRGKKSKKLSWLAVSLPFPSSFFKGLLGVSSVRQRYLQSIYSLRRTTLLEVPQLAYSPYPECRFLKVIGVPLLSLFPPSLALTPFDPLTKFFLPSFLSFPAGTGALNLRERRRRRDPSPAKRGSPSKKRRRRRGERR